MGRLKKIPRTYLYLLAVCLTAISVFLLERPAQERRGDVLNEPLFENFDFEMAARIEIEHLLNGVQLEKREGKWRVAGMPSQLKKELDGQAQETIRWEPADPEKIDLTFSILSEVFLTSLAGTNPKRHGYFEANKAGMQVRFFDAEGKVLAHLYVGKAGPAFTESYVRREGDDKVYLADRYLRSLFSVAAEDWRRKEGEGTSPKEEGNK